MADNFDEDIAKLQAAKAQGHTLGIDAYGTEIPLDEFIQKLIGERHEARRAVAERHGDSMGGKPNPSLPASLIQRVMASAPLMMNPVGRMAMPGVDAFMETGNPKEALRRTVQNLPGALLGMSGGGALLQGLKQGAGSLIGDQVSSALSDALPGTDQGSPESGWPSGSSFARAGLAAGPTMVAGTAANLLRSRGAFPRLTEALERLAGTKPGGLQTPENASTLDVRHALDLHGADQEAFATALQQKALAAKGAALDFGLDISATKNEIKKLQDTALTANAVDKGNIEQKLLDLNKRLAGMDTQKAQEQLDYASQRAMLRQQRDAVVERLGPESDAAKRANAAFEDLDGQHQAWLDQQKLSRAGVKETITGTPKAPEFIKSSQPALLDQIQQTRADQADQRMLAQKLAFQSRQPEVLDQRLQASVPGIPLNTARAKLASISGVDETKFQRAILADPDDTLDIAMRMGGPSATPVLQKSLLSGIVQRAAEGNATGRSKQINFDKLISVLQEPNTQTAFGKLYPLADLDAMNERTIELADVLKGMEKRGSVIKNLGNGLSLIGISGAVYEASHTLDTKNAGIIASTALGIKGAAMLSPYVIQGTESLVDKLLINDALRKSALDWAHGPSTGRVAADGGRLFSNWLSSQANRQKVTESTGINVF